jgi:tRNA pseudouridine38/39 synthase
MSKYSTRHIAIKYAYLGWHYNGLAFNDPEMTPLPTVELELFKALEKTKLVASSDTCNYSRCGRTDKGVSAMGQVSAITVRTSVPLEERTQDESNEMDYPLILNSVLPETIRVLAWCPVEETFDARFSCLGRQYRYFFTNLDEELDIDAMRTASAYFLGEHDFRNFCKLDVQKQINNFHRRICRAEIVPYQGLSPDSKMWAFELHGTAFLWHQVRCMMAILFLVGQRLEKPELVRDLLDTDKYPTKPDYEMAHDVPLVLYDCLFDGLDWRYPEDSSKSQAKLLRNTFATWHEHKLQETLSGLLLKTATHNGDIRVGGGKTGINTGVGFMKYASEYRSVAKRRRQDAFEVMNERYRKSAKYERQQAKLEARQNGPKTEDTTDTA